MDKTKRRDIRLTGTVYCDWNATFVEISRVPANEHLAPGDLIVWSWSGDKRAPSSRSHSGVLRASVVVGVRKMRRAQFHVHHIVDEESLMFSNDEQRERRLVVLVDELRRLVGRRIQEVRFGYTVLPADRPSVRNVVAAGETKPDTKPVPAGVRPLVDTASLPPGTQPGVPRGRIKPFIRSEPPHVVRPTRRRTRRSDSRQGCLF
jgi:hypothetical protein